MINVAQRRFAERVMQSGHPIDERPNPATEKATIYGLVAATLAKGCLDAVEKETLQCNARTISEVTGVMGHVLFDQLRRGPNQILDGALAERATRRGDELLLFPRLERLASGVQTAMGFTHRTLATLQCHAERNAPVTKSGLLGSQRVTFSAAMVHIMQLKGLNVGSTEILSLPLSNGERGPIYTDNFAGYSPSKGLHIVRDELNRIIGDVADGESTDPHIGCPATLLPGFIRRLHCIGAEALVANRVIMLAESEE
ncbi:hypothetical protein EYC59_01215 [Candidatus Saccharibacteria bacterium]|nr:MAG: hypothetical protein EYC59_01215 [Candidatus Saccharibacteria bacterium]